MFFNELLKKSYLTETPDIDNEVVLIPKGFRAGVDYAMVLSRQDFESTIVKNRAVEPTSEAILLTIGKASSRNAGKTDAIWNVLFTNESVIARYTELCNAKYVDVLQNLEEEEQSAGETKDATVDVEEPTVVASEPVTSTEDAEKPETSDTENTESGISQEQYTSILDSFRAADGQDESQVHTQTEFGIGPLTTEEINRLMSSGLFGTQPHSEETVTPQPVEEQSSSEGDAGFVPPVVNPVEDTDLFTPPVTSKQEESEEVVSSLGGDFEEEEESTHEELPVFTPPEQAEEVESAEESADVPESVESAEDSEPAEQFSSLASLLGDLTIADEDSKEEPQEEPTFSSTGFEDFFAPTLMGETQEETETEAPTVMRDAPFDEVPQTIFIPKEELPYTGESTEESEEDTSEQTLSENVIKTEEQQARILEKAKEVDNILAEAIDVFKQYGVDQVCSIVGLTFLGFADLLAKHSGFVEEYLSSLGDGQIESSIETCSILFNCLKEDIKYALDALNFENVDLLISPVVKLIYEE